MLATAGKQVLFFPKGTNPNLRFAGAPLVLADGKSLALKGSTELTSVDLVKRTGMLMIATTERTLLTRPANLSREIVFANPFATVGLPSPPVPVSNCRTLRSQRLIVRNAQGGDDTSTFVADSACQQLVRYDVTDDQLALTGNTADDDATSGAPLVALAVGEGNAVTCEPSQSPTDSCELISGGAFRARINTSETTQLLVLQIPNLCDGRVNAACSQTAVDGRGTLKLNVLLPPALQAALGTTRKITIPPYMFSARGDGGFGVVFIQADEAGDDAGAEIELEIQTLIDPSLTGPDYELGVAMGLPRLPVANPIRVLNQDIAAYAPDNPSLPTVRGFEATPITTGAGSMLGGMRGFSAVIYGLQHDVYPPSRRTATVGIRTGITLGGSTPGAGCELQVGSLTFDPDETATNKYFLNLIACLLSDEEELLKDKIPGDYPALEHGAESSRGQADQGAERRGTEHAAPRRSRPFCRS